MRLEVSRRASKRAISLTPLIDIVFILLLFFMLASNFQQWRSIKLNTPGVSAAPPSTERRVLQLLLHADGSLELEGQTLLMGQLPVRLEAYLDSDPQPGVIVLPDKDVALQTLVSVFDMLQSAGVRQLTLGEL